MTTVRDIVHHLEFIMPWSNGECETVDQLVFGDMDDLVHGVAVTFIASYEVLQDAVQQEANLIISHEGLFYQHMGGSGELSQDPVYAEKLEYIVKNNLAVYRLHDRPHRTRPDWIVQGMAKRLGWRDMMGDGYRTSFDAPIVQLSPISLGQLINQIKKAFCLSQVRVVGHPTLICRRAGLLPGYRGGGAAAIPYLRQADLDVIIVGEGPEWETAEYVRDAVAMGHAKAMVIIGHQQSEEAGMEMIADSLRDLVAPIPVRFFPLHPVFRVL
ncbi:hypothetical protein URH17368_0301 [Alicyclobacillus hesperidum URH17-3-68]|uniref:Nif3-like dinuclear metal center hexameric protein n=1 Tax=Alicyclobacillus hesperidum TaxID=89784 RepID=UPI000281AAF6|nr:Nif3-like dinuclear metal center hexameric protein [Alicyclobacillus hesperidum]EJY57116.1 hypothetical protein URH17368_0301 [Alicyclobacillus hesperidum URH17-3-68]KRW91751.1 hypothetical protein SD51_07715 [Alicyclobacillus tengchongensis]GLG00238.1 hypothetical protein Alches_02770 [Alicyclobacillus hesperidum subsp. aegles]